MNIELNHFRYKNKDNELRKEIVCVIHPLTNCCKPLVYGNYFCKSKDIKHLFLKKEMDIYFMRNKANFFLCFFSNLHFVSFAILKWISTKKIIFFDSFLFFSIAYSRPPSIFQWLYCLFQLWLANHILTLLLTAIPQEQEVLIGQIPFDLLYLICLCHFTFKVEFTFAS